MNRLGWPLAALLPLVLLTGAFAATLPSNDPAHDAMRAYVLSRNPGYDLAGTHQITWGHPGALQTVTLSGDAAIDHFIAQAQAQGSDFCLQPPANLQPSVPGEAMPARLPGTTCFYESGFKKVNDNPGAPGATCPAVQPLGQNSFGDPLPAAARNIINAGTQDVAHFGIASSSVSIYDTYTFLKFGKEVKQTTYSRLNNFPPPTEWPLSLDDDPSVDDDDPKEYAYGAGASTNPAEVPPTPPRTWEFLYVDWEWLDQVVAQNNPAGGEPVLAPLFGNTLWIYCDVESASSGRVYNRSIVQPLIWEYGSWT